MKVHIRGVNFLESWTWAWYWGFVLGLEFGLALRLALNLTVESWLLLHRHLKEKSSLLPMAFEPLGVLIKMLIVDYFISKIRIKHWRLAIGYFERNFIIEYFIIWPQLFQNSDQQIFWDCLNCFLHKFSICCIFIAFVRLNFRGISKCKMRIQS